MPTKLIEVALPLDVINKQAAREKTIRHGHPSTLHLWWARRPLAACRAVIFAQLVDDPSAHADQFPTAEAQDAERQRLFRIIERLVPWEASSDESVLEEARAEIQRCYPAGPPPLTDPFCGSGSIPLEAQRLGLEAHGSDLNPVAVLITKALIELPFKFAGRSPAHPADLGSFGQLRSEWKATSGLAEDVRWYGRWMREQAEQRIGHIYPKATLPGGGTAPVIAWLWARTVTCPNPACGATMPLARSFWLGKKKGKEAWIHPVPSARDKNVTFAVDQRPTPIPVEHSSSSRPPCRCWICAGTVGRQGAKCLVCENPVPLDFVRREGQAGRLGAQLMAIVAEGTRQRLYLPAGPVHEQAAHAERPTDVPETELPERALSFRVQAYGMTHHADLFTNRQLSTLCTFSDLIEEVRIRVTDDSGGDKAYADAVATYLAFTIDRLADLGNSLCRWEPNAECPRQLFARQAIPMVWDFAEGNCFSNSSGSWNILIDNAYRSMTSTLFNFERAAPGRSEMAAAQESSFEGMDLVTDPPYYDNLGYADLSDFFYVWLRRSLRYVYPGLFTTMLTPKSAELIATPYRFNGSKQLAEKHFERGFAQVFERASKEQFAGTPIAVFYAFKQSETDDDDDDGMPRQAVASTGWEKMLEGLLGSGLSVTGTWPMRTEMSSRMVGQGTNALASSIVLVCRPRPATAGVTDRRGFQQALRDRLAGALRNLQSGGVAPVDLAQVAIGPGMAVFSSYAKVVEPSGGAMSVRTALGLINQVLDEVAAEQEGEFDEDTRWAIAWYAENGMDDGPFGRADDLSRAKNVSVEGLVRAGIVKSGAGKVRLLDRSELDPSWDPAKDSRLTIWEVTQQLIRRLMDESEASAADLLARVGGLGEPARDLAYRLFLIAESKKWAKEAGPYNALAAAWPELSRRAALGQNVQETLI
jgi:putative DNA methylase